jgi:VWFA-related protein
MVRVSWLIVFSIIVLDISAALILAAQQISPAPGQSPASNQPPKLIPRSHDERESRYQAAHRIILNVRVSDASGKPVTGLSPEDFTLLDSGQPQKIVSFREVQGYIPTAPTHIMFILDTVNNSSRSVANDRREIEKFLKRSHKPLAYPISIALLTGHGINAGQPSRDPDALISELNRLGDEHHAFDCTNNVGIDATFRAVLMPGPPSTDISAYEADCQNQRFTRSVTALNELAHHEVNVPGRLILIWLGSGWPLLSNHKYRPDSQALKQDFFYYLVVLSTALREAQITLDAVTPKDFFHTVELRDDHDNSYFNGVPAEPEATAGSLGLQNFAHQSGGLILEGTKNVASDLATCIDDADSYYVLSFDTAPTSIEFAQYHPLQVKINRPGLTARTNTLYYSQP